MRSARWAPPGASGSGVGSLSDCRDASRGMSRARLLTPQTACNSLSIHPFEDGGALLHATTDRPDAFLPSYRDRRIGIEERFLQPVLAGDRTIAVLSTPLDGPRSLGWVICHSFGMEQIHLQPLEVAAARRLAAAGFPSLRFHAPGCGA